MAGDELEGPVSLHREDGAVIPTWKRMGEAVGLRRIEEKDVVGIRQRRLTPSRPSEYPPAYEHDAVRRVRLFGAFRLDMGAAAKIHDGDAQGLEEQVALGGHRSVGTRAAHAP